MNVEDAASPIAEETKHEKADRLLREYSRALIGAQTSRLMSDWFEAGKAFDRFMDALMEAEVEAPFLPIPVTF